MGPDGRGGLHADSTVADLHLVKWERSIVATSISSINSCCNGSSCTSEKRVNGKRCKDVAMSAEVNLDFFWQKAELVLC
ncbi:hypothetical protein XELAEV_18015900mg [Xenopus laevis]|uniref:Uncharacterized protein n=1 Tax=Xenopus laevis TaxID=8355 RepID=A0A974DKI3_XENLA|nr:hypothetical protein XELAEV_18015900mg [Xenopus laevis]